MKKNATLTKKREKVLGVLKKSHDALSAAEVFEKVEGIDLATVYRALAALHKKDLIKKISFDGKTSRYEYSEEPHHHAICDECDAVIHFSVDPKKVEGIIDLDGFDIKDVEIIVRGNHV